MIRLVFEYDEEELEEVLLDSTDRTEDDKASVKAYVERIKQGKRLDEFISEDIYWFVNELEVE